jgi:glutathione-independent formaldehyde dehydrogenase
VGLMAAYSAFLRGAARVFVVDKESDRLDPAKGIGADGVDFSHVRSANGMLVTWVSATSGRG